jgi:hypothetical protein
LPFFSEAPHFFDFHHSIKPAIHFGELLQLYLIEDQIGHLEEVEQISNCEFCSCEKLGL